MEAKVLFLILCVIFGMSLLFILAMQYRCKKDAFTPSKEVIVEPHPVLSYQRRKDQGVEPANYKDPLRIPSVAGPLAVNGYFRDVYYSRDNGFNKVPVPAGALKETNERYNRDVFRQRLVPIGAEFPYQEKPLTSYDYFRPNSYNQPMDLQFFGNTNAYIPFQEIQTPWEKIGLLTSTRENVKGNILNLYRRSIAPLQDVWEYQVQDKDGFIIKLNNTKYLEDGDTVNDIIGKKGEGPWKVHIFVSNKYILI